MPRRKQPPASCGSPSRSNYTSGRCRCDACTLENRLYHCRRDGRTPRTMPPAPVALPMRSAPARPDAVPDRPYSPADHFAALDQHFAERQCVAPGCEERGICPLHGTPAQDRAEFLWAGVA